jgi:hypothetical protein
LPVDGCVASTTYTLHSHRVIGTPRSVAVVTGPADRPRQKRGCRQPYSPAPN